MTPAQLDGLEKELLAERERRMWADWEATIRERGSVPCIIIDQGDGADRKRQLEALGNPRFAIVWETVSPPAGGVICN